MSLTKRYGLVASAATLSLTGASIAGSSNEADEQDLQARIAELEARLERFEAQQAQEGEKWLTEQRAAEIRSLVQDVLHDADTRASLLQGAGAGAGHDGHSFFLQSADGNFRLNVGGQIQSRWMLNYIDEDADPPTVDSTRYGFEISRARLVFWGHVVSPDWTYKVESDFGNTGVSMLQDAWINYDFGNGWNLKFGQQKAPLLREELVHSSRQLAVERSLINAAFTADRVGGLTVHYNGEPFRFAVTYNDGLRSLNGPSLAEDTEFALTARGELMIAGNWEQFDDFASWSDDEFGALVGAAIHYEKGEVGTPTDELDILVFTIDGTLEFGGANVFGAFVYSDIDDDAFIDASPLAFLIQGGFFFTDNWEGFARFEWGDSDEIFGTDDDDLLLLTFGVNNYISGNQLKWTTDFGYAFDGVAPFWVVNPDAELTGWRSSGENDDQFVLRTQLQLLF